MNVNETPLRHGLSPKPCVAALRSSHHPPDQTFLSWPMSVSPQIKAHSSQTVNYFYDSAFYHMKVGSTNAIHV
jgi:hypothetical protein